MTSPTLYYEFSLAFPTHDFVKTSRVPPSPFVRHPPASFQSGWDFPILAG